MKKYLFLTSALLGILLCWLPLPANPQSPNTSERSSSESSLPGGQSTAQRRRKVIVIGGVWMPTTVELERVATISEAIAVAGGVLRGARLNRVRILRAVPNSSDRQEIRVDLKAILKKKAEDVLLLENDIVVVPSTKRRGEPACIFYGALANLPWLIP